MRVLHTKRRTNENAAFLNPRKQLVGTCRALYNRAMPCSSRRRGVVERGGGGRTVCGTTAFQQLSSFLTAAQRRRRGGAAAAAMRPLLSEVAGDWEGQPTHVYCRGPLVH